MFKNFFLVAIRNLAKNAFFAAINIIGLSIGLAAFFTLILFVMDELTYDNFQSDIDNIYRMDFTGSINGSDFVTALASAPTAGTMKSEFPEVKDATRIRTTGNYLFRKKNETESFKVEKVTFADSNFFEFFDIPLLQGNPTEALKRPNTLVISEKVSKKIFGSANPVGQAVILDGKLDYEVTGVYQDMPANAHFHFDMMLSMEGREESKQKIWMSFNFNTYLKLKDGYSSEELEAKFPDLVNKYIGPEIEQFLGMSMEEFTAAGNTGGFSLTPMKSIHLYSDKLGELEANGDIRYVYIFSAIAAFILLLACINFMNLATARSANRAKEVGVRKVMGAYRNLLVFQFLNEAFLIVFISIVLAFGLCALFLPAFNTLSGKSILFSSLFSPLFLSLAGTILIVIGLLAGSYPALYLSSFRPIEVLKGKLNLGMKSGKIRSALVILQFSVSIGMIISTAFVYYQLNFVQSKKLGYDKERLLMVADAWQLDTQVESFRNDLLAHSGIINGTVASFLPVQTTNNNNLWFKGKNAGQGDNLILDEYNIDHHYIETLGMRILDGRNFSKEFTNDTSAVLINQATARQLGYENPIGEFICTYGGSLENPISDVYKIIGVIEDFHFATMRELIRPLIFTLGKSTGFVTFKLTEGNPSSTIQAIESKWKEMANGAPFEFFFMDERYAKMHQKEQQIGKVFAAFAILSIFIACLGLFGLASFTTEQRTKEIGIRKVLGASVTNIVLLLSKEFSRLIILSFLFGAMGSYFMMKEWLNGFAYRVNVNSPWVYLISGMVAFLVAWFTMSILTYRAAKSDPVYTLKNE